MAAGRRHRRPIRRRPRPAGAVAGAVAPADSDAVGAVPGGIDGGELPAIFRQADLTPVVLLLSLADGGRPWAPATR